MTPKEKAKELYCKYTDALNIRDLSLNANPFAKQCALIAVDEILKSNPTVIDCDKTEFNYKYWTEVKQDINEL